MIQPNSYSIKVIKTYTFTKYYCLFKSFKRSNTNLNTMGIVLLKDLRKT